MAATRTALVIGAGIAGSAVAIGMLKAGIRPVIYESGDSGSREEGAFLTLSSNGINALRVLDADRAALTGFPTPWITLRSGTGKVLGRTRTGQSASQGTVSRTIRRADLYRALRDDAVSRGCRIAYRKRLVHAEQDGNEVRAVFSDGDEVVGDVLIGCDGVHSTVRRLIDPACPRPVYAGLVNTGGYARGALLRNEQGHYEMVFGRRAFFGYVAAPDDEVWWFANLPQVPEPERGELARIPSAEWAQRLLEIFGDDAGPAVTLIKATQALGVVTPIHTVPHVPRWYRDRMALAGDAAHAPSPTSGQGASLSIEDAVVLARCLRDSPDPSAAFGRYEHLRRPRVQRIVRWAARINNSKAAGPVGRVVRDALLPVVLRATADSRAHRSIYEHRLEWWDREGVTG